RGDEGPVRHLAAGGRDPVRDRVAPDHLRPARDHRGLDVPQPGSPPARGPAGGAGARPPAAAAWGLVSSADRDTEPGAPGHGRLGSAHLGRGGAARGHGGRRGLMARMRPLCPVRGYPGPAVPTAAWSTPRRGDGTSPWLYLAVESP